MPPPEALRSGLFAAQRRPAHRSRAAARLPRAQRLSAQRHGGRAGRVRRARRHHRHLPERQRTAAAARSVRRRARAHPRLRPADPALARRCRRGPAAPGQRGAAGRRRRSSGSGSAISSSSARQPAIRCSNRSPRAGPIRAWSTGCRCSTSAWSPITDYLATDCVGRVRPPGRGCAREPPRDHRRALCGAAQPARGRARHGRRAVSAACRRISSTSASRRSSGLLDGRERFDLVPFAAPTDLTRPAPRSISAVGARATSPPSGRARIVNLFDAVAEHLRARAGGRQARGDRRRERRLARAPAHGAGRPRRRGAASGAALGRGGGRRRRSRSPCCRSSTASSPRMSACSPRPTSSATA